MHSAHARSMRMPLLLLSAVLWLAQAQAQAGEPPLVVEAVDLGEPAPGEQSYNL